jgi:hypothetical protein
LRRNYHRADWTPSKSAPAGPPQKLRIPRKTFRDPLAEREFSPCERLCSRPSQHLSFPKPPLTARSRSLHTRRPFCLRRRAIPQVSAEATCLHPDNFAELRSCILQGPAFFCPACAATLLNFEHRGVMFRRAEAAAARQAPQRPLPPGKSFSEIEFRNFLRNFPGPGNLLVVCRTTIPRPWPRCIRLMSVPPEGCP